jgi:hypothetical protein
MTIAMFPAFKQRNKVAIPVSYVLHRGYSHEALLFMQSFPFVSSVSCWWVNLWQTSASPRRCSGS